MTVKTVVRGGHVVSLDPAVGTHRNADILIQDGVIAAVGGPFDDVDAEVIDATGTIVIPGFVDTHRHTWQTTIRGLLASASLDTYRDVVVDVIGPAYLAEDIFHANRWGAWEALNAGVTTIVDWSHCNNTPEHADAGVEALLSAGIRAVYAHGTPSGHDYWVSSAKPHPEDARRVRETYFPTDGGLLTFALAVRGPRHCTSEVVRHDWELARSLGARMTMHSGFRRSGPQIGTISALHHAGLLGPDTTYVHLNNNTDTEIALIADSGGSASLAPYVELVMGHGHPPIGQLLRHGIVPSLSVDITTTSPGDMFTQMRSALADGRMAEFDAGADHRFRPALRHDDVLGFATTAGAAACGLNETIGTISPGKDADLVLIRADAVNTFPGSDPAATVVSSADTSNVDTVMVRGVLRKRHGELMGVDLGRLRRDLEASRERLTNHVDGKDREGL
jgi:cytosine/adenosine deaminase-related metal-dependent hydrolase